MTISPPHAHPERDHWLTKHRHAHILLAAQHHTASISSMAEPAKPAFNLRRWVWLSIFIGIPTFWVASIFLFFT